MKRLTAKEEEIMGFFWTKGPLFVKELLTFYDDPKPHFNTLSTIVRGLEEKGYLSHEAFGNTYRYFAIVTEDSFRTRTLKSVISKYFNNSFGSSIVTRKRRGYFHRRTKGTDTAGGRRRKRKETINNSGLWEHFLSTY